LFVFELYTDGAIIIHIFYLGLRIQFI